MKLQRASALTVLLSAALLISLASACSKPASPGQVMSDSGPRVDASAAAKPKPPTPVLAASSIAYTYIFGLEVRADALAPLMHRHQASCAAAGPSQCQLLDSELHTGAMPSGTLNIRGAPAWLAQFRATLGGDADRAGGKIVQDETSAEDLTRSLVDTQATERAETALRDRLQGLLETRPGRLADLLDLEKALATVQGQLDATRSELAELQGRVQMSKLTITYETPAAQDRLANPLSTSLATSGRTFLTSLAALISVAAALAPWVLVLGAALVSWLIWLRRSRRPRPPTALGQTPD